MHAFGAFFVQLRSAFVVQTTAPSVMQAVSETDGMPAACGLNGETPTLLFVSGQFDAIAQPVANLEERLWRIKFSQLCRWRQVQLRLLCARISFDIVQHCHALFARSSTFCASFLLKSN
jgi:hypothetical protein